ncbi:MAG: hypothetical protein ACOZBL_00795 [Patescibacteria group bacterium]
MFKTLNNRYINEQDPKKKDKYESIVIFLNEFLEDYKDNSYKYSYEKSEKIEHFSYWFEFYVKNNLLKNASSVIDEIEKRFP